MLPVDGKKRGKVKIETGTKALHIWDIVEICSDCVTYCREKTKHIMEDTGFEKAGGFMGHAMNNKALERQTHEVDRCESTCFEVKRICPSSQKLRDNYEGKTDAKPGKGPDAAKPVLDEPDVAMKKQLELIELERTKDGKFYKDKTTANRHLRALVGMNRARNQHEDEVLWQERPYENVEDTEGYQAVENKKMFDEQIASAQLFRCEVAAEEFSKTLFSIVNKPTAIKFDKMQTPGNLWDNKGDLDKITDDILVKESAEDAGGDPRERLATFYEGLGVTSDPVKIEQKNAWRRSVDDGLAFDAALEATQKAEGTYQEKERATAPRMDAYKF